MQNLDSGKPPIRLLIVDDHRMFRQGLRALIEKQPDITIVGECDDGLDAIAAVEQLHPEVILLDINMPSMDGVETTAAIMRRHPDTRIVILTVDQDALQVFQAIKNGARGYLLKSAGSADVIRAIRTVASGAACIDPLIGEQVLDEFARIWPNGPATPDGLSERDVTILRLIAAGKGNKDIGIAIGLSEHRVKNLITGIFHKLGLSSRTQAGIYAAQHGFVERAARPIAEGAAQDG